MSALAVRGLTKSFGGVHALDDLSFDVAAGQITALIGPNGAGKSTCFNLIGGQLTPDRGTVALDNVLLRPGSARGVWRAGIGRTFQIAAVFASLTVEENVELALLSAAGQAYRWWRTVERSVHERARALLDDVGLVPLALRQAGTLAYGDAKRLELALALASAPRVLLMDEPTAGMAQAERHEAMAVTRQLVERHQLAVLFTEHSMDVVFAHADHVIVLAEGRLVVEGDRESVRDDERARAVYFGARRSASRREP